jgi:ABC-type antimicrobial peptide transport system permease subunit
MMRKPEISVALLDCVLFLAQKLATMRSLISQTLTATHDQISSWNGLGRALMTVIQQFRVASCVSGAMAIAAYLGCVTILHITTLSILSLHPVELNVMGTISTSLGVPNMSV